MNEGPPAPSPSASGSQGNVTRLEQGGKEIFLVGTAHVSRQSVDEVREVIAELRPDVVCVELDPARFETLTDETRLGRLNARELVVTNRAGLYLASLVFSGFQKRLGDRLGVKPGTEMLAAIEAANAVGATVVLADRDLQATLMRCYRRLGAVDRLKVLAVLAMLPFAAPDLDAAEVERLKRREAMDDVMTTFAREMPDLQVPLITERDRYLMASAEQSNGERIVAVVGAAHVPGMVRHLGELADRDELSLIPEASRRERASRAVPAIALLLLIGLARLKTGSFELAPGLLGVVSIATAGSVLLLSLAFGVDVLAALCAALFAPATLFVPALRLGRLTALVQVRRAPPTSEDTARIRDDILLPRAARKNSFIRALLASTVPGFAETLGAGVGFAYALVRVALAR